MPDASDRDVVLVDPKEVAKCALDHYKNNLNARGKPRPGEEWTIYAALVVAPSSSSSSSSSSRPIRVVSCATGSKCTTTGPDGWTLRDSHAEVLCRRGWIREMMMLKLSTSETTTNVLPPESTLHLYISDSPCGDASIYPLKEEEQEAMNFTGAKVVVVTNPPAIGSSDEHQCNSAEEANHTELLHVSSSSHATNNAVVVVAREATQTVGKLRTKSGRSNLPTHLRSSSMSCSDKLLRWCILGLQGSWLWDDDECAAAAAAATIRLSSIVVSRNARAMSRKVQKAALERAVCGRMSQVVKELQSRDGLSIQQRKFVQQLSEYSVSVHVVDEPFPDCKTEGELLPLSTDSTDANPEPDSRKRKLENGHAGLSRKKKKKLKRQPKSPCGVSFNWQQSTAGDTEVVVGARGIRQGKKPKSDADYIRMTSRLSRGSLLQLANKETNDDTLAQDQSFRDMKPKRASTSYTEIRNLVFSTTPFQGWLVDR